MTPPWDEREEARSRRTAPVQFRHVELLVPAEIPLLGDARRKNWAKVVSAVDDTKASGWAFEGDFIDVGGIQDVPAGAVVLVYGERGSRANPQMEAAAYRVHADGTLSKETTASGRAWARTLRDEVSQLLAAGDAGLGPGRGWDPGLMAYDDGALVAELERRGYQVDATS